MRSSNMNLYFAVLWLFLTGIQFKPIECGNKMDPEGLKTMLKPMSKSCKTKTGVSDATVAATVDGIFARERPLMCYFRCLMIILKAMNKKSELTPRDLNKNIDLLVIDELAVRMKEISAKCLETERLDLEPCELAFNLVKCGYALEPSLYFLPV